MSVLGKDGSVKDAVVVLKTPKLESDKLTFNVQLLEGDLAGADGGAAVFIDIIGRPFTPMYHCPGWPRLDDQNTLRIGARGPSLIEDFHFREKIFHFDHERIPERVVHARGYGAHSYFETYKSLAKYTRADIFQRAGEKTPAFVRFSTVAGSKGSFDLARDVRGFAAGRHQVPRCDPCREGGTGSGVPAGPVCP